MLYLLKSTGLSNQNVQKIKYVQKVFCRRYRFRNNEKDETIKVRVIGSGSYGDPASLYIRTSEHSKAIFNCGEGTFRLMYAKGFRFKFITNVFCTRNDWKCVGGVPSLARAIYDRCSQFPTFHGPPELESCLKRFASLTDLNPDAAVSERNFNADNFHDDLASQTDFVNLHSDQKRENAPSVIAYVTRLKPRDGNIIPQKLADLNLPSKLREQLFRGKDVTLKDGTTITTDQVRARRFPGASFLVIDVPSKDYLSDLERNEELNMHLDDTNADGGLEFVAHFVTPEIIETPEYQRFLLRLNAKKHFALNESNLFCGLKWVHKLQYTLNSVDDEIFPFLRSKYNACPLTHTCFDNPNLIVREPITFEPASTFTTYLFPINDMRDAAKMAVESEETEDEIEDGDEDTDETDDDLELGRSGDRPMSVERARAYPKMVILGTGSSFPGVTKTATAILVHTSPDSTVLLDCGEGTAGQIRRFYGDETPNVINNLKAIFISHMHGDHHMGIMDLFRMRQKYMPSNRQPLVLMAPKEEFGSLLNFYEEKFGGVSSEYNMVDNDDLINSELSDEHKKLLNVISIRTCRTPHTDSSFAISLRLSPVHSGSDEEGEFKLTFSGDTIPCKELVELGRDSTLLIHEATLEDTLAASAATKKHSTFSQAIEQGREMNAKFTLLTHFSQRYRNLPPIKDDMLDPSIGVAFDNMELVPSDLSKLNKIYLQLKEIFKDEVSWNERRSRYYHKKYNA